MLLQENADIASKQAKANPIKVTRAQIAELNEKRENIALGKNGKPEPETHLTAPLEENVNRYRTFLDFFLKITNKNFQTCSGGGGGKKYRRSH